MPEQKIPGFSEHLDKVEEVVGREGSMAREIFHFGLVRIHQLIGEAISFLRTHPDPQAQKVGMMLSMDWNGYTRSEREAFRKKYNLG